MTASPDTFVFRVSPQMLKPLGIEQLSDPALAVLELVKNSWDADASTVSISVDTKRSVITVIDDGLGISKAQFRDEWLLIGASKKRVTATTSKGRPVIGEKGIGRLATYALGGLLHLDSRPREQAGFSAHVSWSNLFSARELSEYLIDVGDVNRENFGTTVEIHDLKQPWTERQTSTLKEYVEFLSAVPSQKFTVSINVDEKAEIISSLEELFRPYIEAEITVKVDKDGVPYVSNAISYGDDYSNILFRTMDEKKITKSLANIEINLRFFRRTEAKAAITDALKRHASESALEDYVGIRIFRDGINVPPYGYRGNDWAALDKLRTATGGPTKTPGNSQLIGAVKVHRENNQFVVTAGRSGFTSHEAVEQLSEYVRWAAKQLGTVRRAQSFGITKGEVPVRSDVGEEIGKIDEAKKSIRKFIKNSRKSNNTEIKEVIAASLSLLAAFEKSEETLRLYAQLASTGIAATSFAHELRGDFDVMTEAVSELTTKNAPDQELLDLTTSSWKRIKFFVRLFQLVPVKSRRQLAIIGAAEIAKAIQHASGMASSKNIDLKFEVEQIKVKIVPAELDSILINLVSNSVKAISSSANRKTGKILIKVFLEGEDMNITIDDNGCGVPENHKMKIFEPSEGHFSEGTGMGLPIMSFILSKYNGGTIDLTQAKNEFETAFLATFKGVKEN